MGDLPKALLLCDTAGVLEPAELSGFGPLLADIARQTAEQRPDLQLRFSVTTSWTPWSPTRHQPRCGRACPPAHRAAGVPSAGRPPRWPHWSAHGESEPDNVDPACRRHHTFKHSPGSQLVAFSPGTFGWQTPLGMQSLSRPDPPVYDDHRYIHPRFRGAP